MHIDTREVVAGRNGWQSASTQGAFVAGDVDCGRQGVYALDTAAIGFKCYGRSVAFFGWSSSAFVDASCALSRLARATPPPDASAHRQLLLPAKHSATTARALRQL